MKNHSSLLCVAKMSKMALLSILKNFFSSEILVAQNKLECLSFATLLDASLSFAVESKTYEYSEDI
jgi:hypothetical protein